LFSALRAWRAERAKVDEVPAYVVFPNTTLAEIADRRPRTLAELARIPGVGPTKLERYGEDVLAARGHVA
jgi:superfamily II DNA helicase RecQ